MTGAAEEVYNISLRKSDSRKICVDPLEEEGIYLYPAEVKREGLEDGQRMTREEFERLRVTYALPRAKKRALGILSRQDQTESQLREKLVKSRTDSRSLEEALDFVREYGYIDDARYARDYLSAKRGKKSFRVIRADLTRRGIPREILDAAFEENEEQGIPDLEPQFERYIRRFPEFDRDAARRTYAHFVRKGYHPGLVTGMIRRRNEETTNDG